jgi:hypothetical protein
MAKVLGDVVEQGCYDGSTRKGNAKFCHNCMQAGGKEIRWKFKVMEDGKLVGHVIASLKCDKNCGSESQQKEKLLKIARALIK